LFNAGYMVLEPSSETYQALLKETTRAPPRLFGNILDCTEMGLLNKYFYKHSTLLPMASPYNIVQSPFVHWFGDHKPWENLDTSCYPSPYFANKLWAQMWVETVESMKDMHDNGLFQTAYKAVLDKSGLPSHLHSHSTSVVAPEKRPDYPTTDYNLKKAFDYDQLPLDGYSFKYSDEFRYAEEMNFKYAEERFRYADESTFKYADEQGFRYADEQGFRYADELGFTYAEENSFKYADENSFKYAEELDFKYAEEKFRYAEEKNFKYAEEKNFKYAEEKFKYAEEKAFKYQEEKAFRYREEDESFRYKEEDGDFSGRRSSSLAKKIMNTEQFVVVGN